MNKKARSRIQVPSLCVVSLLQLLWKGRGKGPIEKDVRGRE